jgi:hypothetical protein
MAIACLGQDLPPVDLFDDMPTVGKLDPALLPRIHGTSLPLSTETRKKGYILSALTGAIRSLYGACWLRVPGVHSTGDAKTPLMQRTAGMGY